MIWSPPSSDTQIAILNLMLISSLFFRASHRPFSKKNIVILEFLKNLWYSILKLQTAAVLLPQMPCIISMCAMLSNLCHFASSWKAFSEDRLRALRRSWLEPTLSKCYEGALIELYFIQYYWLNKKFNNFKVNAFGERYSNLDYDRK